MCVRQMAPPGRGDCWILKIAHAPSPINVPKNGFRPRKGVAFLWEASLQKKFYVREGFRCGACVWLRSGLRQVGYVESQNVAFEYRWAGVTTINFRR
jgi:hypothetical protein